MRKVRHGIVFALLAAACGIFPAGVSGAPQASTPKIGIVYTQPHPVINAIIAGFKEVVQRTYPRAQFVEHSAEGRPEEYGTAVLATLNAGPTLLAPITTPITKLTVKENRGRVPVVFMGVTDPVGAGVARSIKRPGIATGSSDLCPFKSLLRLTRRILPNAHVLGLPYNPTDEPAVFGRRQLIGLAPKYGFSIVDRQVTSASELSSQVGGLASRVDGVIIAADNLMMENPGAVASAAAAAGKPAFACDSHSVQAGAVAGVSVNYRDVGKLAGQLAVRVLQGAPAGSLPVAVLNEGGIDVNLKAACTAKVTLPQAIVGKAEHVTGQGYRCASSR
jgi:putative ABC transport system substrate-binding protein